MSDRPSDKEVNDLDFAVDLSARYHARRQAFYARCRSFSAASSAVLAAAAGGNALAESTSHRVVAWLSLIAAVIGALDWVVGTSKMANKHSRLRRSFLGLLTNIQRVREPTWEQFQKWKDRRLRIEAGEPPIFRVLQSQTRNELCTARGYKQKVKISWFYQWTAQLFLWHNFVPHIRAQPSVIEVLWRRWKYVVRRRLLRKRPKRAK